MEIDERETNPYAPADIAHEPNAAPPVVPSKPRTIPAIFLKWLAICGVAATPSFFFGMIASDGRWVAMVLGVLVFVFAYTAADWMTAKADWRQTQIARWTLRIGYGTRVLMSIVFPVGMFVDLYSGMASLAIVHGGKIPEGSYMTDLSAFITTLVQGVLLNVVLAAYMGIIALIIWAIQSFQGTRPA